jgi:putative transcriptional regulator
MRGAIMSELLDVAQDMARDLFKVGAMNEISMREIDALCLPPKRPFKSEEIRRIRTGNHVSQAVFASIMGIGKSTVQQWEQGLKKPNGAAQRLLDIIDRKGLSAYGCSQFV